MGKYFPAFKAYDVRGKVPSELNPELAYDVARAFADELGPSKVCIGYDIRLSGPGLADAFAKGLNDAGVEAIDLGMVGTEMVYFATAYYGFDGGVMITASHNPADYNGLKMVRSESRPISGDTGLNEIEKRAYEKKWERNGAGARVKKDVYADFVEHLKKIVSPSDVKPLNLLLDAGNGAVGVALEKVLPNYSLKTVNRLFEPDGHFPNGVPNPILEESRAATVAEMKKGSYDFGVAWDGDYDRCFFFDEKGSFIEGYYIVGLLAQAILHAQPGSAIVYDPRLTWNTLDIVGKMGGKPVLCKSGHAFIKEKMRAVDAVYGGEMSAHHYFKAHWYCDSGLIPFLLVARLVSHTGRSLGDLVNEMIQNYPCSGEINSQVADVPGVLKKVEAHFSQGAKNVDHIDGLSVEFGEWRFNLRGSNTEPLIRLNVETRGNHALMEEKRDELLAMIRA
jgi:phosphomannomutase